MKATQKDFAGIAARAARQARVFFFCGPDEAGAQDALARIVSLLPDPGERIDLSGAELKKDPVRLGDEARSTSLFGATRHIVVRAAGEEAHDALAILIESEAAICPVLVVATGATDKSRSAKLLASRADSLVAMFWPPDRASVSGSVRTMAGALGLRMGSDIADRIASACGYDTRLARSELEKLALYLDAAPEGPRTVAAADLDAIAARAEDDDFTPLVDAVLGGAPDAVGAELRRLRELGLNPVGLLLAFERRAAQLVTLAARAGDRRDLAGFVRGEATARRVPWGDQVAVTRQLGVWGGTRAERLAGKLITMHQALLANSQDAPLLLAQGLTEIARSRSSSKSGTALRGA